MVLAMVILAACLARSVLTKLLTNSFRLPLTSGVTSNSRLLPPPPAPPLLDDVVPAGEDIDRLNEWGGG